MTASLDSGNAISFNGIDFSSGSYDPEFIDIYIDGQLQTSGSSNSLYDDYVIETTDSISFNYDLNPFEYQKLTAIVYNT